MLLSLGKDQQLALTQSSNKTSVSWIPFGVRDPSPYVYSSAPLGFMNSLRGEIHTNQPSFLLLHGIQEVV